MKTNDYTVFKKERNSLTGGLNNSITAILPLIPTSLMGRNPSGVTTYISILVFLAMIKFKSSEDVKLPVKSKVIQINNLP